MPVECITLILSLCIRDVRTRTRRRKLFAASADGSRLKIRGRGLTQIIDSGSALGKLTRRAQ